VKVLHWDTIIDRLDSEEGEGKTVPEYCGLIAGNTKSVVCPWGTAVGMPKADYHDLS